MMTHTAEKWNRWLANNMFVVVLSGLVLGPFISLSDSSCIHYVVIGLFAYMTLVTSLSTSFRQFAQVLGRPWIPIWTLVLVHLITPLTAWCVGSLFFPNEPYIRMGYLIGASIPIGVTSLMWTALVNGNLAVSLVAVTLDTLVVPFFLPVFCKWIVGQSIQLDCLRMIGDLVVMVTAPSIAGMVVHDITGGKTASFSRSWGGITAKAALFFVILINSSLVMPQIHWNLSVLKILAATLVVVSSGYLVGFLGSFLLKNRTQSDVLTMMYNVGIRNIACGIVLALTYFPPAVAIPITLAILYQQPLATIIPRLFKSSNQQPACI